MRDTLIESGKIKKREWERMSEEARELEGIKIFEKRIGKIKWLHRDEVSRGNYRYKAIEVNKEMGIEERVVCEGDKIMEIASELGVSDSAVSCALKGNRLIKGKYKIERNW